MSKFIHILILIWICVPAAYSQTESQNDTPYPDYKEEMFLDMDFEPNLMTPEIPEELKGKISDYIVSVAESLKKYATIDIMRESDVFVVNIPSDDMFLPNDTLLNDTAIPILNRLIPLIRDPYMYKLVIAVHSDDTGSDTYLNNLTTERLNSIYDWFMDTIDHGDLSEDLVIIPYAMGDDEPLMPNDSREHRQINRRIEFYFIPGPGMIDKARKNTLK